VEVEGASFYASKVLHFIDIDRLECVQLKTLRRPWADSVAFLEFAGKERKKERKKGPRICRLLYYLTFNDAVTTAEVIT
jgi:hypothetical protein